MNWPINAETFTMLPVQTQPSDRIIKARKPHSNTSTQSTQSSIQRAQCHHQNKMKKKPNKIKWGLPKNVADTSKQPSKASSPLRSLERDEGRNTQTSPTKSPPRRSRGRHRGGGTSAVSGHGDRGLSSQNRYSTLSDDSAIYCESNLPPERSQSQVDRSKNGQTHLKESDKVTLKGYNIYSTFSKEDERAAGGSTILVNDNVIHSTVQLTTDLQAVAVRLSLDKTITLCSIYIPPNSNIDKAKLKNLTDQLPTPFIIMGYFNAHNPLSGSKSNNAKGKIIEDFVSQEGLCIFQSKMFEAVQDPILTFNTVLTSIADRTIPKTSANPKHLGKPWYDDACDQAI
ncbi:Hypothetical predicted protein [Mytilus galloprovincialis]|uniref:Endonuclease/exonuclease/phosphatase domain-containing protein n=2 Tax=Mytilus galloprovincialis TaxID=29158 RepID=A0A8B6DJR1_MYTGA|nr:Hypothetical predicted protein [Mytilus galloprovincialis]